MKVSVRGQGSGGGGRGTGVQEEGPGRGRGLEVQVQVGTLIRAAFGGPQAVGSSPEDLRANPPGWPSRGGGKTRGPRAAARARGVTARGRPGRPRGREGPPGGLSSAQARGAGPPGSWRNRPPACAASVLQAPAVPLAFGPSRRFRETACVWVRGKRVVPTPG